MGLGSNPRERLLFKSFCVCTLVKCGTGRNDSRRISAFRQTRAHAYKSICARVLRGIWMIVVWMACCPVCYDLIREPVVFPCDHEVCRECFDHSLNTANFCCPLCRKRVSSWARRHAKDPVDHRRKRELEERMYEHQEGTTMYSVTGKRNEFLQAILPRVL